jgi:hypothetical protein
MDYPDGLTVTASRVGSGVGVAVIVGVAEGSGVSVGTGVVDFVSFGSLGILSAM